MIAPVKRLHPDMSPGPDRFYWSHGRGAPTIAVGVLLNEYRCIEASWAVGKLMHADSGFLQFVPEVEHGSGQCVGAIFGEK